MLPPVRNGSTLFAPAGIEAEIRIPKKGANVNHAHRFYLMAHGQSFC